MAYMEKLANMVRGRPCHVNMIMSIRARINCAFAFCEAKALPSPTIVMVDSDTDGWCHVTNRPLPQGGQHGWCHVTDRPLPPCGQHGWCHVTDRPLPQGGQNGWCHVTDRPLPHGDFGTVLEHVYELTGGQPGFVRICGCDSRGLHFRVLAIDRRIMDYMRHRHLPLCWLLTNAWDRTRRATCEKKAVIDWLAALKYQFASLAATAALCCPVVDGRRDLSDFVRFLKGGVPPRSTPGRGRLERRDVPPPIDPP